MPISPFDASGYESTRRFVLVLAATLAFGCGGAASLEEQTPDKRQSASRARASEASWSEQIADVRAGRSEVIRITEPVVSPEQWQELARGCEKVNVLDVQRGLFDPDAAEWFASLGNLERFISGDAVTDAHLARIVEAPSLTILNLPRSVVTDDGMTALREAEQLTLLRIGGSRLTAQGLQPLLELENLRWLHLIDTRLTAAHVAVIVQLEQLESFYLDGQASPESVLGDLLRQRPTLHFHYNSQHLPGDPLAD